MSDRPLNLASKFVFAPANFDRNWIWWNGIPKDTRELNFERRTLFRGWPVVALYRLKKGPARARVFLPPSPNTRGHSRCSPPPLRRRRVKNFARSIEEGKCNVRGNG
jgi:hypothetical protein